MRKYSHFRDLSQQIFGFKNTGDLLNIRLVSNEFNVDQLTDAALMNLHDENYYDW